MTSADSILRHYPADCRPARIEPLGNAGGMSGAQFWRITAPCGTLVLRRWPNEHPTPDRLRFIHSVLKHATQQGIAFLPVPIATQTGQSFIESGSHLWELAPWLAGAADYESTPSVEKLRAAMTALAQFHIATTGFQSIDELAGPAPAIKKRLARLRDLANGGVAELSRSITNTTWPELAPLARQFIAALPRAMPLAIAKLEPLADVPLPLQPCIRDIWHDHVLFTGDRVTGIIDFGAVEIDTPATDIARLLGSLSDFPPRSGEGLGEGQINLDTWIEGLAAYSERRPLSQSESLAVSALDTAGTILAGCNWIRWIYVNEREFDRRAQIVERFGRLVTRCQLIPEPQSGDIT